MKIWKLKRAFKYYGVLILICFSFLAFKSNFEKTKTINKEFDVTDKSIVKIIHDRGSQNVEYYDGSKAILVVDLVVRGDDEADVETVLSKYSIDLDEFGNQVNITSSANIKSQQTNTSWFGNTKHLIRFKDGTEIRTKVELIRATMKLKIPKIALLDLSNKYNDINVGDLPFDLKVKLFSGRITAGNIDGDFDLDMKYGKGRLGNLNKVELDLFDSELEFGNMVTLDLKDKYSELGFGNMQSADVDVFDGDLRFGNVTEELNIHEKYSEIEAGVVGSGEWDLFDAKVEIESIEKLRIKTKYSDVKIERSGDLLIESFDDNFDIGTANNLEMRSSKYSEYDVDLLNGSMSIEESFDDDFDIRKVGAGFSGLSMDSKYTDLSIPLSGSTPFQLEANVKYGSLSFLESLFEIRIDKESGSERRVEGKMKGANESSPKIMIDAYSSKIRLE